MQPDIELMSLDDQMDMSSSGGLRWRSDEASDEEDKPNWGIAPISSGSMPVKGKRRRFAAR
ncbi:unnamed protein product [Brassica rapa subsp. narinosa]